MTLTKRIFYNAPFICSINLPLGDVSKIWFGAHKIMVRYSGEAKQVSYEQLLLKDEVKELAVI